MNILRRYPCSWGAFGLCQGFGILLFSLPVQAQIVPDQTLGKDSSTVDTSNLIRGGAARGINLFHSFSEFNVRENQRVDFENLGFANILARVSGKSPSNILGTLGVQGKANLFLINPNGIYFGSGARLSLGGSFLASTASSIRFRQNELFSSVNTANSSLPTESAQAPTALIFASQSAPIKIEGSSLNVGSGQTLAIVGGTVDLNGGRLQSEGARIDIAAISSNGQAEIDSQSNTNFKLRISRDTSRSDIALNNTIIDVTQRGSGAIQITGRNIDLSGESRISSGIKDSLSLENVPGNVSFNASGKVTLRGSTYITNDVGYQATGNGGDITIQADSFFLTEDSRITATMSGKGNAGNISIQTIGVTTLKTGALFGNVESGGEGQGGDITIQAGSLSLSDGGAFQTVLREAANGRPAAIGKAGNVVIEVKEDASVSGVNVRGFLSAIFSEANPGTTGNAGDIHITAQSFSLTDGGRLTSQTRGNGDAGSITIRATDQVKITSETGQTSQILTDTSTGGRGGDITIFTRALQVSDQSILSTSTGKNGDGGNIIVNASNFEVAKGGQLLTTTSGTKRAGNIRIDATEAVLKDRRSGLFANTAETASGDGGNITVNARNFMISNNAEMNVDSKGSGQGGDIQSTVRRLTLDNGSITSGTQASDGGNIQLTIQELLLMRNGSRVSATAGIAQAKGNGGNVEIHAEEGLIVAVPQENNDITANAFKGNGGTVRIDAQGVFGLAARPRLSPLTSDITASSEQGVAGRTDIVTLGVDPNQGLQPESIPPGSPNLSQACQSEGAQQAGRFVNSGRGGLTSNPGEALRSSEIWEDMRSSTSAIILPQNNSRLNEDAQGWIDGANGTVILTTQPKQSQPLQAQVSNHPCHVR
ncbi:filamentous hemagglutinin N-terminal domain-containing protein [Leptolyngbya sp. AN03gr2]